MQGNRDQAIALVATILAIATPAFANDVNTIVGTGTHGFSGDNGPALAATIQDPRGIAVANDGTLYFADSGNLRIRKVTPAGSISTIVGNGIDGDGRVTLKDGLLEALAVLLGSKNPRYDINHDGQVNIDDLLIVGSRIGKSC